MDRPPLTLVRTIAVAAALLALPAAAARAAPLALTLDVGEGLGLARTSGLAAPATTLSFRDDVHLSLGGLVAVHPRVALRLQLSTSTERLLLGARAGVLVRLHSFSRGLVYAGADLGALGATLIGTIELRAELGLLWRFGCDRPPPSQACWAGAYAELGASGWVWPSHVGFLEARAGLMLSAPSFWP